MEVLVAGLTKRDSNSLAVIPILTLCQLLPLVHTALPTDESLSSVLALQATKTAVVIKVVVKVTKIFFMHLLSKNGGSGEIRTHEQITPSPVFKTGAFNRSATLPSLVF